MNKIVCIYLISKQADNDGNKVEYSKVCEILHTLINQVTNVKNKAVRLCWEWSGYSLDYNRLHGEYPDIKKIAGKPRQTLIYNETKNDSELNTACLSSSLQLTLKAFDNSYKEFIKGQRSIITYKANQPLDLHKNAITLSENNGEYNITLSLLNKAGMKKYNINRFTFKAMLKGKDKFECADNSAKTILQRCIDGEYKICGSQLFYDKKKRQFYINLAYGFEAKKVQNSLEEKILGVDLGVALPVVASVYGEYGRFIINGGEIEAFRKKIEARRLSMLKQTKYCGNGRTGHGRAKRISPAFRIEDKIKNFRDTCNHKYSRALIDYAVKNNCTVIQMEDLTGITSNANRFMKNWSYYDLQTKIKNKAAEVGIAFRTIKPAYTSQRCSKCGFIDKENRPEQKIFCCKSCGYSVNADFNASQNISIKGIDKIIEKDLKKV